MIPLASYLLVSALLFSIGLAGALARRNAILVIAFWRYGPNPAALTGIMFAIFAIGVAAAEAAVGLALIISVYRHYKTTNLDQIDSMRG
jgi:NADH:ubiquinone oxidoreductase subunit K